MIRMEVKGLDELERQLMALGEKVATKVLRDAGREALKVVEEDMKQHAGFDETSAGPHMRDSIKIRSSTRKGKGNAPCWPQQAAPYEGAGAGVWHG